jgi:anti-sigma regulatory factor (Ser/Thr protein kinase)
MSDKLIKKGPNQIKKPDRIVSAKFKPRARLLLQLGDQLIKNESIALVELVKNSYDADASVVKIIMEDPDDLENGIIIIEDDGFGMDIDTVVNVWLEPGSDFKSDQIKHLQVSPKFKRLPIGEKGIGRFGVHKLGDEIRMTTKKAGSNEVFVEIDWSDFDDYTYLDQVPITVIERGHPQVFKENDTGTSIVITGLRKGWQRSTARSVKRSITALVSPFDTTDSFKADFEITDKPGWFEGLLRWEDIKEYSLFHFRVIISNDSIKDFTYEFIPWASMPKLSGRDVDIHDELVKTFLSLKDEKENPISLEDYDIGEIRFEGYIFDQDAFVLRLGVSDKSGFKSYLKSNGGIRVFRDGLRIYDYGEPENDWLNLDYRRFLQPTKKISNNLILGAVHLRRRDSSDLIEKTNREGFVENAAYEAFRRSILHAIHVIETLRYSDKLKLREFYGPTPKSSPVLHVLGDLKTYIDRHVADPNVRDEISKYLIKIEADYKRINENLLKAAGAGLSMSVVIHEVEKIISEVTKVLEVEDASDRLIDLVKHLSSLIDGYSEIISRSGRSQENIKEIIEQALFNTEYRMSSHKIQVLDAYKTYRGNSKVKIASSLLLGSLMNALDNSIFWLKRAKEGNRKLKKKIYIGIHDERDYVNIVIADNGTGFLLPTDEITEPFVSAKPGGMGLGLHIASEVMLAQGGKLTFPEFSDFEIPKEFEDGAILAFGIKR